MPRYTFKCKKCSLEKEIDLPLSDSPRVGATVRRKKDDCCASCGSRNFIRTWGDKAAPFRMNFRRTSVL